MLARIGDMISTDYGIYRNVGIIFPSKALCDKLCKPGKIIVRNPVITLLVVIIVYPILCLLILPFFLVSFLFTSIGSWVLFFGMIVLGTRSLARTMIFPGSLQSVQRNVSQEYVRGVMGQFERIASISSNTSIQIIGLVSSGSAHNCMINLKDITDMCDKSLPKLLLIVKEGVYSIETTNDKDQVARRCLEDLYISGKKLRSSLSVLLKILQTGAYLSQVIATKSCELSAANMSCIDASSEVNAALLALKSYIPLTESGGTRRSTSSNGGGGYFGSIKSTLVDFFRSDNPVEKSSFAMMRKHICTMFPLHSSSSVQSPSSPQSVPTPITDEDANCLTVELSTRVRRIQLVAPEGHTIDAVMVYAHDVEEGMSQPITDVATVLFCPPNAGFYECLAMSQPGGSWLWYYVNCQGLNVCVFNYRGYGSSSGVPDPTRVQLDGVFVANHLLTQLKVRSLLVHGESVGGLVACRIAKECKVGGLVCDRTFSSLDAVARRMLGDWAGLGLSTLGRWQTDSVDNYLNSSCPKVVIQDPDDDIVFHAASIKAGIAGRLLLGDSGRGIIPSHGRDYRMAEALGHPVTLPQHSRGAVLALVDRILLESEQSTTGHDSAAVNSPLPTSRGVHEALPLTAEFVEHLAACIVAVARRAAYDEMTRGKRDLRQSVDGSYSNSSVGDCLEDSRRCDIDEVGSDLGEEDSCRLHNSLNFEERNCGGQSDLTKDGVQSPTLQPSPLAAAPTSSSLGPAGSNTSTRSGNEGSGGGRKVAGVDKWGQMEGFCAQSIHDSSLTTSEKFWLALSRTDGFGGQLLGQAVSGGLDSIRTWINCCVIWGACGGRENEDDTVPRRDSRLPRSRVTVSGTIRDFETLINQLRSSEQSDVDGGEALSPISDSVQFILRAFKVMEIRRKDISRGDLANLYGAADVSGSSRIGNGLHIGRLISVHCGHNGFPMKQELDLLSEFVSTVNGDVEIGCSEFTY